VARSERDIIDAHIADPTMTHEVGSGADATTPSGAEYNKARDDLDTLAASVASILVALEEVGIVAKA